MGERCIDCNKLICNYAKRCKPCSTKGKLSNVWAGDKVAYRALHAWVERNKQKIDLCENCKLVVPKDLANISGEYKRDINDYKWLCRKCHMDEDGRNKTFWKNGNKKSWEKRKQCHS